MPANIKKCLGDAIHSVGRSDILFLAKMLSTKACAHTKQEGKGSLK